MFVISRSLYIGWANDIIQVGQDSDSEVVYMEDNDNPIDVMSIKLFTISEVEGSFRWKAAEGQSRNSQCQIFTMSNVRVSNNVYLC